MLDWADANFNCFGPMNQRTEEAFPVVQQMVGYAFGECVPGKLRPMVGRPASGPRPSGGTSRSRSRRS